MSQRARIVCAKPASEIRCVKLTRRKNLSTCLFTLFLAKHLLKHENERVNDLFLKLRFAGAPQSDIKENKESARLCINCLHIVCC